MKKTLVLSMMLCGSVSLVLAGCGDDKNVTDSGQATVGTTAANDDTTGGDGDQTTTGDGDGDGDGDAETGGGLFLPDNNDIVGISECDPFAQDCPEGEKCVPYASSGGTWDANKCVALTGDGSPGDTCTSTGAVEATDTCGSGSLCWDVMESDGQLVGVCTEFCTGDPNNPQCGPSTNCLIANSGSINLCIVACDPLLQDCGAGLACFFAAGHFACIFTTSDIPLGEPCGFINDCVAGTGCLDAEIMPNCNGSACCGSFCDLSDPFCPQGQTECTSFFEEGMAPPGYEDVGVCIIPGS
jgi:hypothetical protein